MTTAVAGWGLQQLGSSAMVCGRRRWGLVTVITSSASAQCSDTHQFLIKSLSIIHNTHLLSMSVHTLSTVLII